MGFKFRFGKEMKAHTNSKYAGFQIYKEGKQMFKEMSMN